MMALATAFAGSSVSARGDLPERPGDVQHHRYRGDVGAILRRGAPAAPVRRGVDRRADGDVARAALVVVAGGGDGQRRGQRAVYCGAVFAQARRCSCSSCAPSSSRCSRRVRAALPAAPGCSARSGPGGGGRPALPSWAVCPATGAPRLRRQVKRRGRRSSDGGRALAVQGCAAGSAARVSHCSARVSTVVPSAMIAVPRPAGRGRRRRWRSPRYGSAGPLSGSMRSGNSRPLISRSHCSSPPPRTSRSGWAARRAPSADRARHRARSARAAVDAAPAARRGRGAGRRWTTGHGPAPGKSPFSAENWSLSQYQRSTADSGRRISAIIRLLGRSVPVRSAGRRFAPERSGSRDRGRRCAADAPTARCGSSAREVSTIALARSRRRFS